MVYSDMTAAEAIIGGLRDLEAAYSKADHYRSGPTPAHVEDDLRLALRHLGEGLAYVVQEVADPDSDRS